MVEEHRSEEGIITGGSYGNDRPRYSGPPRNDYNRRPMTTGARYGDKLRGWSIMIVI